MQTIDYDKQAEWFLCKHGMKVIAKKSAIQTPPTWRVHGYKYFVTIERNTGEAPRLCFDFWDSLHNKENGLTPTDYDILACLSADASCPTDPNEVASEFGYKKTDPICFKVAEFARKLQNFFTECELNDLYTIS